MLFHWVPRSEDISDGVPNPAIHWLNKARTHVKEEISANGIASGHLVNLSTTVKRYVKPWHDYNGPARSTLICSNLLWGTFKISSSALTWRWILAVWHATQALSQAPTCFWRPCQSNLLANRVRVAQIEGCYTLCTVSNTRRLQEAGTIGQAIPVEVSQRRVVVCQVYHCPQLGNVLVSCSVLMTRQIQYWIRKYFDADSLLYSVSCH